MNLKRKAPSPLLRRPQANFCIFLYHLQMSLFLTLHIIELIVVSLKVLYGNDNYVLLLKFYYVN